MTDKIISFSDLVRTKKLVIPAKAGIHFLQSLRIRKQWIPAFAGMTNKIFSVNSVERNDKSNSIINYQLPIINYQLSIINYQLSIINCFFV
ncbi:Uncharacterized protein dnm_046090 [Desulfonema magnum]|uniref:Uncharacterized protein n=1 Tax=Desulfonema magnum TaxID=45655 RepID=A0A975BNL2_9BACT|nr:Uncharacterized protein dnm_046090 [Desulfonema magnum]